jgi:hypothetical protein
MAAVYSGVSPSTRSSSKQCSRIQSLPQRKQHISPLQRSVAQLFKKKFLLRMRIIRNAYKMLSNYLLNRWYIKTSLVFKVFNSSIHSQAIIVQDWPLASLLGVSWSHTYRHAVGLLWTSDQPVAETSTYTGQHNTQTQQTNIHAPSGIRTRDPSKRPQTYALDRAASGIGLRF